MKKLQEKKKVCKLCGERIYSALGFCGKHYQQFRKGNIDENGKSLKPVRSRRSLEGYSSLHEKNVEFIRQRYFAGGPFVCSICGLTVDFYQMDGHHQLNNKTFNPNCVSDKKHIDKEPEILAEFDTLKWVCAHCHIGLRFGGDDVLYADTNKTSGIYMDRQIENIFDITGRMCSDCRRQLGRRTACFHHKDINTKISSISQILGSFKFEFVLSEVKKCVLLCANCHRKRHKKEDGFDFRGKVDREKRVRLLDNSPIRKKKYDNKQGCKVSGCKGKHSSKGFCKRHYSQYTFGILDDLGLRIRDPYKGGFGFAATLNNPDYVPDAGCKITGCSNKYYGKGFCRLHYRRWKTGAIDKDGKQLRELQLPDPERGCAFPGCDFKHFAKGFCNKHYDRFRLGKIDEKGNPLPGPYKRDIRTPKMQDGKIVECKIKDCHCAFLARGFCKNHYEQFRYGTLDEKGNRIGKPPRRQTKGEICKISGCSGPVIARGYCRKHYASWYYRAVYSKESRLVKCTRM